MNTSISQKKLVSFKYMLILTIPIFIELMLQVIVGYCDQFMMSDYGTAVTAITNSNVIYNMVILVFTVLSTGAIILISQYKGARDSDNEEKIYSVAFILNVFLGIIVTLILVLFSRFFFKWIKVPTESYDEAMTYMYITGGCVLIHAMSLTLSAFLRSNALMRESMMINILVNVINVLGNIILIPRMQIAGAAISSTVSRTIGCLLMFIVFRKKVPYKIHLGIIKNFPVSSLKKLISIGGPSGGEALSYNSSQIVIQSVVNVLGTAICDIKTYASMFAMVTYMFTSAISQAMQVIIGQLLGAGNTKDTDKKVKQTIVISLIMSTLIAVVFYLTAKQVFRIFHVDDPQMLELAKTIMFIEIFLEFGRAINIVCVRALQTSGDIKFPTIVSTIFCWSVAVLGSFILGSESIFGLGLAGVWIAMATDELSRAVIFLYRWHKGKWKKINLLA